jgi:hypothetical protein
VTVGALVVGSVGQCSMLEYAESLDPKCVRADARLCVLRVVSRCLCSCLRLRVRPCIADSISMRRLRVRRVSIASVRSLVSICQCPKISVTS